MVATQTLTMTCKQPTKNCSQRIVIMFTDPAAKLSPFTIHKGIEGIAGTVAEVIKMKSGDFLVECVKKTQVDNLQYASMLAGVGIKASLHFTLNSSRGVI